MNTYQISFNREDGTEGIDKVTARNEAAAKKDFREIYRHSKVKITGIELTAINEMASKKQERETLDAIRKMVDELGPQSYLATAFEGCFEDADQNIEFDAAFSMKERYEVAKEEAAAFQQTAKELSRKYEAERRRAEALEGMVLSANDLEDCRALIRSDLHEKETACATAAADIVKFADDPQSPEFKRALTEHRTLASAVEHSKALLSRVDIAISAGE